MYQEIDYTVLPNGKAVHTTRIDGFVYPYETLVYANNENSRYIDRAVCISEEQAQVQHQNMIEKWRDRVVRTS